MHYQKILELQHQQDDLIFKAHLISQEILRLKKEAAEYRKKKLYEFLINRGVSEEDVQLIIKNRT